MDAFAALGQGFLVALEPTKLLFALIGVFLGTAVGVLPGIGPALTEAIDKMAKSKDWAEILKQKGWDDAYLSGDDFAAFLKEEQARVKEVLTSVGLVKS